MVKKMKKTPLGLIPNDWKLDILEHCLKIQTGTRNTEDKQENGKYPFFVRSSKIEHIDTYHYDCEAVLTAGDGVGTGKVFHYINGKFDAHQRVYILTDFDGIEGKYFYYYFRENFLKEVSKYTAKSSVDSVRRDMIAKMVVPIPKLEEQTAIAEALSNIDRLIFSLQKLIEKKKAIKQGAMQELLTGKKCLPGFSEEWTYRRVGELCSITKGQIITEKTAIHGNVPVIAGGKTPAFYHNVANRKSDVITISASGANAGYIAYHDYPIFASDCSTIENSGQYDVKFIYYALLYHQQELIGMQTGGAQPHIHPKEIGVLMVPRINQEEQRVIANVLSDMDSEIEQLEKKLSKYQQIKQGMMQELLTGRIRLVDADGKEQPKTQNLQEKQPQPAHNQHFDDAVMIAGIVNAFYSEKYPLGRKKVQKLLYLVRRKEQADISAFHKKAAGPYADEVRYKGGEPIAQKNKYIQVKRNEKGSRFEKGVQMQQALTYLQDWGKQGDVDWLVSQFQYTSVNELELLATVDMAICDLQREGKEISVASIKDLIRSNKEWRDKLKKTYFRDSDIQRAIKKCQDLFES